MKRRNREISIFNMSTIDLFACATGAFILLTLILLPYYLNIDRSYLDVIAELKGDLEESAAKLADTEADLQTSRNELGSCLSELDDSNDLLRSTQSQLQSATSAQQQAMQQFEECSNVTQLNFMLIVMSWKSFDDIDLHVIDPGGRRFYYDNRRNSGSRGSFEEDSTRGPGNEIWLHPAADPGEYKIFYNFYRRKARDSEVIVRGTVFHQQGKIVIPETTLSLENAGNYQNAPLVATVVVGRDGGISLR